MARLASRSNPPTPPSTRGCSPPSCSLRPSRWTSAPLSCRSPPIPGSGSAPASTSPPKSSAAAAARPASLRRRCPQRRPHNDIGRRPPCSPLGGRVAPARRLTHGALLTAVAPPRGSGVKLTTTKGWTKLRNSPYAVESIDLGFRQMLSQEDKLLLDQAQEICRFA